MDATSSSFLMADPNLNPNDPSVSWQQLLGLPADPQSSMPPAGLEGALQAAPSAPPMTNVDGFWGTVKADALALVKGTESAVGAAYDTTKSAVGTVADDVTAPIASAMKSTYWYVILGVVVLAGALYFVGKGGGIGQAAGFLKVT